MIAASMRQEHRIQNFINNFIFQREAKATKGGEEGEEKNSKGRETEVASKQKHWETYFEIIDYIYAVVFIYVYLYCRACNDLRQLFKPVIDLVLSLEEYVCSIHLSLEDEFTDSVTNAYVAKKAEYVMLNHPVPSVSLKHCLFLQKGLLLTHPLLFLTLTFSVLTSQSVFRISYLFSLIKISNEMIHRLSIKKNDSEYRHTFYSSVCLAHDVLYLIHI